MNTLDFLRRVLPASGLYVAAKLINGKFRNQICDSLEELVQLVLMYDAQGVAAYYGCASYRDREVESKRPDGTIWKQVRVQRNVCYVQDFWADLDVEVGNPAKYESQEAALDGLIAFCQATSLPMPLIVDSGYGAHVHWRLTDAIVPESWKQTAEALKLLAAKLGFKADPACTADMARVLRPVGTWNRKDPNNPRPVELVADSSPVAYATFDALVKAALKAQGVKPPDGIRKVESSTEGINQAFAIQREFPPCSGIKVAERCQQMRVVRDRRGDVPEPLWYAAIQVLCHSIEGDALIHEWSNGHANYSADETDKKIAQVRGQQLGPTLCTTFESRTPGGCDGCPFAKGTTSPAQLGTVVESASPPVVEFETNNGVETVVLPNPPEPYKRREGGGITVEVDGITHLIHEHDIFPVEVANDEFLGYETMRWRHFHPMQGWNEFVLRSSLVAKPVELEIAFRDKNIQPLIRNQMALFADNYIRKLKAEIKIRKLFKAQGWKNDDTEFVLGDKLYRKGEILQAGSSQSAKGFLRPFHSRGSLDVWRNLTWVFNTPKFEAHAFMLLLAFAAPLLKISGRQGFTVNALGDTSAGKTTMARFMTSVYGHPDASWPTIEDSALARVQRMGAHNNLPIYMDESTTIDPKELRNLIYSIPIGKSRTTMKQDYTTREGAEWQTIFVTSTNDSLQGKLQLEKANAEAESLRLFELNFPVVPDFGPIAKIIWGTVDANYGVAGPKYIEYLVNNLEQIKARLTDKTNNVVLQTEREFGMQDKERFWSQAVALTLYGGQLAHEAGVIDFDPTRIKRWLLSETQRMRGGVKGLRSDAVSILSAYMNEHIGGRIIINPINSAAMTYGSRHMNKITSRYEAENHLIYEDRATMYKEWRAKHISPEAICDELYAKGVLLDHNKKMTLTKDTGYGGGQVVCWMIRADHPELNLTDL